MSNNISDQELSDAMEMIGLGAGDSVDEIQRTFAGFEKPKQNYSKLPHSLIDALPLIKTVSELKVILYVLRHTWGFSEYGKAKKITIDEMCNGRKKRDGSRMDGGTGLSPNSVRSGANDAVEHGFLTVEQDLDDLARIDTYYCLNILSDSDEEEDIGVQSLNPPLQNLNLGLQTLNLDQRKKLEKETLEKNKKNFKIDREAAKKRKAKQRAERDSRDPVLAMLKGVEDFKPINDLRVRIENALNLNLQNEWDKNRSPWNGYDKKLLQRERETGQTIEQFMQWYNSDEFRRKGNIWMKPDKIEQFWNRAFEELDDDLDPQSQRAGNMETLS